MKALSFLKCRIGIWSVLVAAAAVTVVPPGTAAAELLPVHQGTEPLPPGALALPADHRPWTAKVAPELQGLLDASAGTVEVIVNFRRPPELDRLTRRSAGHPERLAWIRETGETLIREGIPAGIELLQGYSHIPAVWVRLPGEALAALAADPRVDFIEPNIPLRSLRAEGKALMNVEPLHLMGITGAGVGIAVLDTGVDYRHDELAPGGTDPATSKTIKLWDAVNNDDDPMDDEGHGTAVAGIAGGSAHGVAPGARIVAVKVLNADGSTVSGSLLGGLNKVIESVSAGNPYTIRVLNMSLGGYPETGLPPQPCDGYSSTIASQTLTDMGVLVISSAGNGGCTEGVGHPACGSAVMAVGAVYDATYTPGMSYGTGKCNPGGCQDEGGTIVADKITCYSDSGDLLDVWAPSHRADTTSRIMGVMTNPIRYGFGGTSAAAPYVAGAAALLFEAFPNASPQAVRQALTGTGMPITDSRNGITRNRVDVFAAWQAGVEECDTPAPPENLTASKVNACRDEIFRLRWGSVAGADQYRMQYAGEPTFANPSSFDPLTATEISVYAAMDTPATFHFRVRAEADCGTASPWSNSVAVSYSPTCPGPVLNEQALISGVAQWPGFGTAFWNTDLGLLNPHQQEVQARVTFLGGKGARERLVVVPAGEQLHFPRVLTSLFELAEQDVGALRVDSDAPLAVLSRTYSQAEPGDPTYGQGYPAMVVESALTDGQMGFLPYLRSDTPFYTNLEFVNPGTISTTVEAGLFDPTGELITWFTRNVPAGGRVAVNKYAALPVGHAAAFARIRVLTPGGRMMAFASIVDDASKDPTTVPLVVPPDEGCPVGGCRWLVSGVARWPGFGTAFWNTDLGLLNPGDADVTVTATFQGGKGTRQRELTIPAGQQRHFPQVLTSLFELTDQDVGAVRVDSGSPLAILSRTYSQTTAGDPTFGQGYPAAAVESTLAHGEMGFLPYLRSDQPFYTNLEFVNPGIAITKVEARLFDSQGAEIASFTRDVPAGARVGVSKYSALPDGHEAAYARIRVLTPGGRILAFASIVDDLSKDPTTVSLFIP